MPKLVVLYPTPSDVATFERAYMEEHLPLVRAQMLGVQRIDVGRVVPIGSGAAPFHWMAELHFESMETLQHGAGSPGGQRAAGHAQQISTGGAPTILVVDDVS